MILNVTTYIAISMRSTILACKTRRVLIKIIHILKKYGNEMSINGPAVQGKILLTLSMEIGTRFPSSPLRRGF